MGGTKGAPSPVQVLRQAGTPMSWGRLVAVTTSWQVRRATARGELVRVGRGMYALPRWPEDRAVAAAVRGVLSHESAAQCWRLQLAREPDTLHVTVPHGSSRAAPPDVTIHHSRTLTDADVERGATSALRTVLDMAATRPFPEALVVADSALAYGLIAPDELVAAAEATRGPHRAARLRVARAADGRAANAFESVLRGVLIEGGLDGFEPQVEIALLGGGRVRVDLADRKRKIVIEADSYEFHGTRAAFKEDCRRYNALVAAGWTVLRLPWEDVLLRPDVALATVRAVVRLKDATPPRRVDAA